MTYDFWQIGAGSGCVGASHIVSVPKAPNDAQALLSTTMTSTLARLHRAYVPTALFVHSPSSTRALVYLPSHRHAMMSALSHDRPAPPPSSSKSKPSTSASTGPLLGETPPVVVSSSTPSKPPTAKNLSPNAASPQVAARPPPIPKAERPRPKIRAAKAAITLVRHLTRAHRLTSPLNSPPGMVRHLPQSNGCRTSSRARRPR